MVYEVKENFKKKKIFIQLVKFKVPFEKIRAYFDEKRFLKAGFFFVDFRETLLPTEK